MSLFVFFISLLIVAQHVSGNHMPIIRSWRLRDIIALCWYVPWLQEGGQVRLLGSASMDGFVKLLSWFLEAGCFLSVYKTISSVIQMSLLYEARDFISAFPSFPPYYNLEPAQSSVRPPSSTFKTYFNIILCFFVFPVDVFFKFRHITVYCSSLKYSTCHQCH